MKERIKKLLGLKLSRYLAYFRLSNSDKQLIKKRKRFYLQFLKKGDMFFDVGANIGNRIDPLVDVGIQIIAIEPQESCCNILRKKYGDKVEIIQKGLGEREETKTLYISNNSVLSSFSDEWIEKTSGSGRFSNAKWSVKKQIEMTTLDKIIEDFGKPKYIKIDVEGYELEVLNGLSSPVESLSFEYTVPEQTEKALMCLKRVVDIMGRSIKCNYSMGESMEWALENWSTPEEMEIIINSSNFNKTGFEDIYIRYNSEE